MDELAVSLTLLHTNDIHSHFEAASQIGSYIREVKRKVPAEQLLLIDCGDFLDRVRMETEGTDGWVNRALLDEIGYDAILIGNNEGLTYAPDQLQQLYADMSIPVVCANMLLTDIGAPPDWMVPTRVIDKSGIKIGLIGLTAPFQTYYQLLGWEALDPQTVVKHWVSELRPQVDIVIVMSHLGLRADERMAAEVEGIDLILGGHTHHLLMSPQRNGRTTICAAGKFGQHIGHLELQFTPHRGELTIHGGCLPTDELPRDPDIERLMDTYRLEAGRKMRREVANLHASLDWQPYSESPLGNLLAIAVRHVAGAELGLVNAGQLLDDLQAGTVTELMVHALCPSPINPCLMELRGDVLLRALEESLLQEYCELEIRGFGFRGRVLGALCLDGMSVVADKSRPPYERIVEASVNGEPLQQDRIYRVGTLDMFTFGVGYTGLKAGTVIRYCLPHFIRHALMDALCDPAMLADCGRPRWHLHP